MLYVVRHGETSWNALNKVLGRTDIPLDAKGRDQALELARSLRGAEIDAILCSPLSRAVQTADAVSGETGIGYSVDARLIEQDFGQYEGVDRYDPGFLEAKRRSFAGYPGAESYQDMAARVIPLIKETEGRNILLVTHGGICRIIRSCFEDISREELIKFSQENCELRMYDNTDMREAEDSCFFQ